MLFSQLTLQTNIVFIMALLLWWNNLRSMCILYFGLKCLSKSFDEWNYYICPHLYFMPQSKLVIPGFREVLSAIYF